MGRLRMDYLWVVVFLLLHAASPPFGMGQTVITKWQNGKKGAVSITYDDGSINQFRKALPIMNQLKLPATFFIITGQIPGSQYQGKFIGRPVAEIIEESSTILTHKDNFFERSSAAGFLGYRGTLAYHTRAGALFDAGKEEEAYAILNDLYQKVRNGDFQPETGANDNANGNKVTWDEIRTFAAQGHEFASHTVTHPYLCALDEVNIQYELEKSRDEIKQQLGPEYTFSAEIPYGTEHKRAMKYAHRVFPALRNRMPEPYLVELNRASTKNPGNYMEEYVQWQRGAVTRTSLPMMKSWIDTTVVKDNIWLVLVIHGVDGIGWEALSSDVLDAYFRYIKSKEADLWIAPFAEVTKYMRSRMNAEVQSTTHEGKITIKLSHSLDQTLYNVPLTLKTYVPGTWKEIRVKQGKENKVIQRLSDSAGSYVLYQAFPNSAEIEVTGD